MNMSNLIISTLYVEKSFKKKNNCFCPCKQFFYFSSLTHSSKLFVVNMPNDGMKTPYDNANVPHQCHLSIASNVVLTHNIVIL